MKFCKKHAYKFCNLYLSWFSRIWVHLLKSGRNTLQPQIHFNTATACTKGTDWGRTSLVNGPPQGEITRVKYITTSLISRFPNTVELLVRGDLIFLELPKTIYILKEIWNTAFNHKIEASLLHCPNESK